MLQRFHEDRANKQCTSLACFTWITHFHLRELYSLKLYERCEISMSELPESRQRPTPEAFWVASRDGIYPLPLYKHVSLCLWHRDNYPLVDQERSLNISNVSANLFSLLRMIKKTMAAFSTCHVTEKREEKQLFDLGRIQAAKWRATDPRATVLREQQGIILRGGLCFLVMGKYIFWGHPDRKPL